MEERIAWVVVSLAYIAISVADVVRAIARIVLFSVRARTTPQFDPRHLNVAHVIVTVTWIEIIEHPFTPTRRDAARNGRNDYGESVEVRQIQIGGCRFVSG